jgi:hypothetical protein
MILHPQKQIAWCIHSWYYIYTNWTNDVFFACANNRSLHHATIRKTSSWRKLVPMSRAQWQERSTWGERIRSRRARLVLLLHQTCKTSSITSITSELTRPSDSEAWMEHGFPQSHFSEHQLDMNESMMWSLSLSPSFSLFIYQFVLKPSCFLHFVFVFSGSLFNIVENLAHVQIKIKPMQVDFVLCVMKYICIRFAALFVWCCWGLLLCFQRMVTLCIVVLASW